MLRKITESSGDEFHRQPASVIPGMDAIAQEGPVRRPQLPAAARGAYARRAGVWLWDVNGKRYLDMMSAYSAASHGHCHPRLVKALTDQARRLDVVSRAYHTDVLGPFLARLCRVSGMDRALPMNTGAEAVETAIKAARRLGLPGKSRKSPRTRPRSLSPRATSTAAPRPLSDFPPRPITAPTSDLFAPGFISVPFADSAAVARAITPNTAAVIVEPIQGEAGIRVPPPAWLPELRRICDEHRVLLIVDEVQSGLGRTGRMFAFQHAGIRPDGIMVGKALGGGLLPVSAFLGRAELMDVFEPGSHGSTFFGGNPAGGRRRP